MLLHIYTRDLRVYFDFKIQLHKMSCPVEVVYHFKQKIRKIDLCTTGRSVDGSEFRIEFETRNTTQIP